MKKIFAFTIILFALSACTVLQKQAATGPAANNTAQAGMPNPASVYCEQHGNTFKIQTAADGSQSGLCIFPEGTSCDEWAYYRGECGPAEGEKPVAAAAADLQASGGYMPPGTSEEITDWWGIIESTDTGAQYDDFFARQDLGSVIYFGIDSMDPTVRSQIEELRDSGKLVHLYGTLFSNVPDYNGSQILVDRIEIEG